MRKFFNITVNGQVYEVEVEEKGSATTAAPKGVPTAPKEAPAPAPVATSAPVVPKAAGAAVPAGAACRAALAAAGYQECHHRPE